MSSLDGWDLDRYRAILRSRARLLRLDRRLQVRFDEEDLVHETLVRALTSEKPCPSESDQDRLSWLAAIQDQVLIDNSRRHHASGRDVRREQDHLDALAASSTRWEENVVASDISPSEEAERREFFQRGLVAIQELPKRQQDAVMAVLILGLSHSEAAERLGMPPAAVRVSFYRGIKRLRQLLDDPEIARGSAARGFKRAKQLHGDPEATRDAANEGKEPGAAAVPPAIAPAPTAGQRWEQTKIQLLDLQEQFREYWGPVEAIVVGRYLAGTASPEETTRVEEALRENKQLQTLVQSLKPLVERPFGAT